MVRSAGRFLLKAYIKNSPIRRGKHWLMENLGRRVSTAKPQRVTLPGGAVMVLDIKEHVQRWIFYFGVYESDTVQLFRALAKPGMTIIDVGANVGQYTLLAASIAGPRGVVHAFEADATNFRRLQGNVMQNQFEAISLNLVALSDHAGCVTLYSSKNDNAGEHSLFRFDPEMSGVTIPAITLDGYMETAGIGSSGSLDIIKIDVQGAEAMVLHGAESTLRTHRPHVICEFEERWLTGMGSSTTQLKAWLRSIGYDAYRYSNRRLVLVSPDEVHALDNLLLVHESRKAALASSFAFA